MLILVAMLWLVLVSACSDGLEPARPGHSLEVGDPISVSYSIPVRPGREFLRMFSSVSNASDDEVVLRGIETVPASGPQAATVVRILIGPRTEAAYQPALAEYTTYPPVYSDRGRKCVVQELRDPAGYSLGPGEEIVVAVWIRADQEGDFKFPGHTISYEREGNLFEQLSSIEYSGTVQKEAPVAKPKQWERPCLELTELLPGNG